MYTGASQFALVGVLAAGGSHLAGLSAALLLGLRNAFYGLPVTRILRPRGWRRMWTAHFVVDESTAMAVAQPAPRAGRYAFWATGITLYALWTLGTLAGTLIGGIDTSALGHELAATYPMITTRSATYPMTTTRSATSTAIAVAGPVFTGPEQLALAGFLAGYTGLTRRAYALDLRQYASWCQQRHVGLFQARRADIECFARDLEARGRARVTITRRLCTVAGFYRYAVEEELLDHSPAAHVRRPRLAYESHATGLDRNGLGAMLVAAGLGTASEHALISLLALNGLRAGFPSAAALMTA
jgi:predicted branched-subunit amino acid permease